MSHKHIRRTHLFGRQIPLFDLPHQVLQRAPVDNLRVWYRA